MDTTPREPRFVLHPLRALRLADSRVGAPGVHRVLARPYRAVPGRLRESRRSGQLRLDDSPALYLHEYTAAGVTVRGVVGVLELAGATGTVFGHEAVRRRQVRQLAQRLDAIALNPAPILLVHQGPPAVTALLDEHADRPPDLVYTDRAGQLQRIWRVTDPADAAVLATALQGTRAVVADGHHRLAAAEELSREHPGSDWDRTLVMLVDQADTPLQLGAIHRSVPGLSLAAVAGAARDRADAFTSEEGSHQALAALGDALVLHDGSAWATLRPADRYPAPLVRWLHEQLLPAWGVPGGRIRFHHTAAEALDRASQGIGLLLPAPTFEQVEASARSGELLPQKATSFQPKPPLGALMRAVPDE